MKLYLTQITFTGLLTTQITNFSNISAISFRTNQIKVKNAFETFIDPGGLFLCHHNE